jgi:hypothetical protein
VPLSRLWKGIFGILGGLQLLIILVESLCLQNMIIFR